MITLEMGNTVCEFVGKTQESLEKRKFVAAETLAGIRKQSYADIYNNVSLEVTKMSSEDYIQLKKIFSGLDHIFLTDEDGIRRKVIFKGNVLSLKKQYIKEIDENIYSGSLKFDEN